MKGYRKEKGREGGDEEGDVEGVMEMEGGGDKECCF
jgi:hypothetical protein